MWIAIGAGTSPYFLQLARPQANGAHTWKLRPGHFEGGRQTARAPVPHTVPHPLSEMEHFVPEHVTVQTAILPERGRSDTV